MSWILDVGVLAILVLFIAIGAHRGAVRTIVEFVGFLASIVAAALLGGWLGEAIYTTFMRDGLMHTVQETISGSVGQSAAEQIAAVSKALPAYVSRFFDGAALSAQVQTAIDAGAASGAQLLADQVIGPVMIMILRAVCTVALFLVLMIVIRLIAKAADLVAKLPVLNQLNKGLGMICGAAKAVLIILLVSAAVRAVEPFAKEDSLFSTQTVQNTVVFEWICTHNPLEKIIAPSAE